MAGSMLVMVMDDLQGFATRVQMLNLSHEFVNPLNQNQSQSNDQLQGMRIWFGFAA